MLVTAAIGAVVGGIIGGVVSYATTGKVTWQSVAGGAALGAVAGLTMGAATSLYLTAGTIGGATALASTSTVVGISTGSTMVGSSIVAAGGGTIVVVGETMSRVEWLARSVNAEVYKGMQSYKQISAKYGGFVANIIGKLDNAAWLINKMMQNYKIMDFGIDWGRAERSSSYLMERVLMFLYQNKEVIQDWLK